MVDKQKENLPLKTEPSSQPTPFLEWEFSMREKTGKESLSAVKLSDGSESDIAQIQEAIKRTTGSSDMQIGYRILNKIAKGMTSGSLEECFNDVSALLAVLHPKDETEALLLGQLIALQDAAMKCLGQANRQEHFYHQERFYLLASKLCAQANATMQTVLKYRSGGQQTVQVIHVHNEGQAIVAQNLSAVGGGAGKKSLD